MVKETYKKHIKDIVEKLKVLDTYKADRDYKELKKMFDIVCDSELFNITTFPKEIQNEYKLVLFKNFSLVSGTLSFMAIQILAAHNIMEKNNYIKKEFYKKKKCGIAINHLRSPKTVVLGQKVDGGYVLNGKLTWASGYKIFDTLLIGFHCDGNEIEAISKFEHSDSFQIGDADTTFVGNGLNTVNIELKELFVEDNDIISSQPMGNYTKVKSASKTVHFCLYGVGICAINHIDDLEFKVKATKDLENLKDNFMPSDDLNRLDNLRVELFLLVQDIVTTSMVLYGGRSILANTIFQKLYRELIMFNSNGLNSELKNIFKDRFLIK
jgi:hypothetical protein